MKKILILTDNDELLYRFINLIGVKELDKSFIFEFAFSPNNTFFVEKFNGIDWIKSLKVKDEVDFLINEYDIILSLHCKQIFPERLVKNVKCINIHPGLNPNNRGWYPQVFSIINSLPCGVTIHEIDEYLDHGPIICQREVKIETWDTSLTAHNKILDTEIDLLSENIVNILNEKYETFVSEEGNVNLKKDFDMLCEINLDNVDTFKNHINKLRALTHGNYKNAYFIDEHGNKVYLKLELEQNKN